MRKSRFTEAQIIGMIKEQETGMPTAEVCRRHGLSPSTFYELKAKYGGMEVSEAARLKAPEDENTRCTLYLAALTASRFDPRFRAFKERMLAAGKAKKVVIVACARKLLTVLNAKMRTGTTYRDAIA